MKVDVYQTVTDRILKSLEDGVAVWRKPWKTTGGYPISISTGKAYRGINVLLLMLEGHNDPRWGTFDAVKEAAAAQAKREGRDIVIEQSKRGKQYWEIIDGERVWFKGGVRKGEKGTQIVFWKKIDKKEPKEGERDNFWMLKTYVVFNATQVEGLPALAEEEVREFTPIEQAEQIVNGYVWTPGSENDGPPVFFGSDRAAYDPRKDTVQMPDPEQFISDESYYATFFHELTHSTGGEKRLKRIETTLFGTDPYAKEELVAEIGASFLSGIAGFEDAGGDQSAAYIGGWLKPLQNDKKFVVQAAAQAQKAVDLILGTTFDDEPAKEADESLVAVPV